MFGSLLLPPEGTPRTDLARPVRKHSFLPPQKQVLVLGARGRLGYACVQVFAQAGWKVLAHVRPDSSLLPSVPNTQDSQVRWISTPLEQANHFGCFGDIHVVINALAPTFTVKAWRDLWPTLTSAAIDIARSVKALLIQPLSVMPYGQHLPPVLHEGTPLPLQVHPLICTYRNHIERQLMAAAQEGVRICALRMGTLYGHSGWGWISTAVARHIKAGKMHWLGPYNVATPWAYAPDVAHTMERVASQSDQLSHWTTLHFAGHLRTGQDWLQAMEQSSHALGWLPPHESLKAQKILWPLWKPAALVSSSVRALCMMNYIWRTPHRLDNQRLLALIGTEPCTDWQTSVQHTLARLDSEDHLHGGVIRTLQGY